MPTVRTALEAFYQEGVAMLLDGGMDEWQVARRDQRVRVPSVRCRSPLRAHVVLRRVPPCALPVCALKACV